MEYASKIQNLTQINKTMCQNNAKKMITEAAMEVVKIRLEEVRGIARVCQSAIDIIEGGLTEGECFRSKGYKALALMEHRLTGVVERVTEIINQK